MFDFIDGEETSQTTEPKTRTLEDITRNCDMVLFNQFPNVAEDKELIEGSDFDEQTEEPIEIFQYFAVGKTAGEFISRQTNLPLYYSDKLNLHVLGVTSFGTPWDSVEFPEA